MGVLGHTPNGWSRAVHRSQALGANAVNEKDPERDRYLGVEDLFRQEEEVTMTSLSRSAAPTSEFDIMGKNDSSVTQVLG